MDEMDMEILKTKNKNMEKLRSEMENWGRKGYSVSSVWGYGEGVYVVNVALKSKSKCVLLSIPQVPTDKEGNTGRCEVRAGDIGGRMLEAYAF